MGPWMADDAYWYWTRSWGFWQCCGEVWADCQSYEERDLGEWLHFFEAKHFMDIYLKFKCKVETFHGAVQGGIEGHAEEDDRRSSFSSPSILSSIHHAFCAVWKYSVGCGIKDPCYFLLNPVKHSGYFIVPSAVTLKTSHFAHYVFHMMLRMNSVYFLEHQY